MKIVCYDSHRTQQSARPVNYKQEYRIESYLPSMEAQRELCRTLWLELHAKVDPTPVWIETWVARVPNFDCGCRSWLREYLVTNPPRYNEWYPPSVIANVRRLKSFMKTDEKRLLLAKHLEEFRSWTYGSLVAEIDLTRFEHDCLQFRQGVFADGTEYQLEFNVFWDDRKEGDVRVCGDLATTPQRPLLSFLPIFPPDVTDSFIMRRDGTFVDE